MPRLILTVEELERLVRNPGRRITDAEVDELVRVAREDRERWARPLRPDGWGPWQSQETDRVPPWPDTTPNKDRPS